MKYVRQMDLINYLIERGERVHMEELARQFSVSVKTIKKDVFELSFYYPIDTFQGNGGGVEMRKGYAVNGYLMSRKQLSVLARALELLKTVSDDPEVPRLIAIVEKKRN